MVSEHSEQSESNQRAFREHFNQSHTVGVFKYFVLLSFIFLSVQLQLSEVIARARKYHQEVTGERGTVIEAHVDKETFKQDLKEAGVPIEKPAVQNFLDHMTADQKGIINIFDWRSVLDADIKNDLDLQETFQVPNLKTGRMEPLISALTEEEDEQFRNMIRRMNTLFMAAKELDVRCMVDAEQTYFQPAIARITMEMMKKYNTEKAIVFNTYQVCTKKVAWIMYTGYFSVLPQGGIQDAPA